MALVVEEALKHLSKAAVDLRELAVRIERERVLAWNAGDVAHSDCLLAIAMGVDNAAFLLEGAVKRACQGGVK